MFGPLASWNTLKVVISPDCCTSLSAYPLSSAVEGRCILRSRRRRAALTSRSVPRRMAYFYAAAVWRAALSLQVLLSPFLSRAHDLSPDALPSSVAFARVGCFPARPVKAVSVCLTSLHDGREAGKQRRRAMCERVQTSQAGTQRSPRRAAYQRCRTKAMLVCVHLISLHVWL